MSWPRVSPSSRPLVAICLFLLVLTAAGTAAEAQTTRGLRLPGVSSVVSDDSSALVTNPAGLGFLNGLDVLAAYSAMDVSEGDGQGLFIGSHVFGPLSLGAGFEFLPHPSLDEHVFRFTFASALSVGRSFSFGFSLHRFVADLDGDWDGLLTADLGIMARPLPWLAVGAAVKDLASPYVGDRRFERTYEAGLAFRPGTDRVLLGTEIALEEESWDVDVIARLELEPVNGLRLGARAALGPRDGDLLVSVDTYLALSLGFFEMSGGAFLGGRDEVGYQGFTVAMRASSKKIRPLFQAGSQAVVLTLGGPLRERPSGGLFSTRRSAFAELVLALDGLRNDSRVEALVLKLRGLQMGWAQTQELRDVIADLRAAGKTVIAHLAMGDTRDYYLASACDRIVVQPGGTLFVTGLKLTGTYLYDALTKIGVAAQFVAIGDYKSFPEMFTRSGPSEPAREVRSALLDGLWSQLVTGIATSRGKTKEQVAALIDGGPYVAERAVEVGLADQVAFADELPKVVEETVGRPLRMRRDWFQRRDRDTRWGAQRHIAVITIDGTIVNGPSGGVPLIGTRYTGDATVVKALRAAARSSRVAAILVRVNTGGGSSIASEHMHHAIVEAAKAKPLAVSFGNAAASGGYYLACGAPKVFAEPATMTGSIGIFVGKFVVTDLLQKLGIHREVDVRGRHGALLSPDVAWNDEELEMVRQRLGTLYDLFKKRVAEGRELTPEAVEQVARGRVWLGSDALGHGLVDEEGGVREALEYLNTELGRPARSHLPIAFYPGQGFLARLGLGATAEAPSGEDAPGTESDVTAAAPELGRRLGALLAPLAPLVAPLAQDEPLALQPVHYEIR